VNERETKVCYCATVALKSCAFYKVVRRKKNLYLTWNCKEMRLYGFIKNAVKKGNNSYYTK
jgi:hypothetical protein